MHTFTRRAVMEDNPESLPKCYGHIPENPLSHEQCGICKIREICKGTKDIPILSFEPFHDIVNKMETFGEGADVESFHCKNSQEFIFHDDPDTSRTYTHDEILNLLSYIFGLTPREFYYIQAKILSPSMTLQQIAAPLRQTRAAISKRFNEMVKARPELFNIIRIRRTSTTQRPA